MRVWDNCKNCPFHVYPSVHAGFTGESGWRTTHRCSYHGGETITKLKHCEFAGEPELATEEWKERKANEHHKRPV